jgi:hypothetical protein
MKRALVAAALAALVVPSASLAGGWATVGLANLPNGVRAGDSWNAQITVLRHGRTPTDGAKPALTITNGNGDTKTFPARPAKGVGKYVAHVVFPSGGEWRFSIDNGLSATGYGVDATTTYAPVTIAAPDGGGGSFPLLPVAVGALGAAALAAISVLAVRRRTADAPVPTT